MPMMTSLSKENRNIHMGIEETARCTRLENTSRFRQTPVKNAKIEHSVESTLPFDISIENEINLIHGSNIQYIQRWVRSWRGWPIDQARLLICAKQIGGLRPKAEYARLWAERTLEARLWLLALFGQASDVSLRTSLRTSREVHLQVEADSWTRVEHT